MKVRVILEEFSRAISRRLFVEIPFDLPSAAGSHLPCRLFSPFGVNLIAEELSPPHRLIMPFGLDHRAIGFAAIVIVNDSTCLRVGKAKGKRWRQLRLALRFEDVAEELLILNVSGCANMNYSISNTAEYGEYVTGPRIVTPATKVEMKKVLDDIQSGKFTRDWMLENKVNQTSFKATRAKAASHQIEEVGAKLRAMMPWIGANKLVDKAKN